MDTAVPTIESGNAPARVLAMQRQADRRDGAPPLSQRLAALKSLDAVVRFNRDVLADAIAADFGHRSREETMLAEVVPILAAIRVARRNLARWMRPERRRVEPEFRPGRAWVEWQPLGCVGILAPWNYPLLLTVGPVVDALAAGNRVIVKPSELTPHFSSLLAVLVDEAIDPTQLSVVTGGVDAARALSALPLDHLLFTGSTAVGREVARAAAETLTPVTLELGGKSPAIVCRDYDLATAARTIALGKFFSAGQTCIAPDYALVPQEHAAKFADAVMRTAKRMYPKIAGNRDYTTIASDHHHERLHAVLREAEQAGATVLRSDDAYAERRLGPVVVLDAPPDGRLMTEEIFGPVLPVIGYRELNEALRFVRDRPRPLALYPFTHDKAKLAQVTGKTLSGGMSVNSVLMHCLQHDLPFGGVGQSGMGAYHGRDGFRRFSHARGVYKAGRVRGFEYLAPPYRGRMRLALWAMLRR